MGGVRAMMILRPYQELIVEHVLSTPRCAVWASMGLGKTSATLHALRQINEWPVLVLAPKLVAASTWPDESKKWNLGLRVVPILGSARERAAALRQKADIYTMNYENLPWLIDHLAPQWPFRAIVADESTRLKSFRTRQGGKRARALAKVATESRRFIELTGTPAPNGLIDLWGQIFFLDQGQRLGRTFTAFRDRWFRVIPIGQFAQRIEPYPFAQAQIEERLRDICLTIDAKDYFSIDEPIVNKVVVDLPPKARALYDAMELEMFLALENGEEVEAFNPASKTLKCLQLASGAIYTEDRFVEVHDAKLQALDNIIEEAAGAPVLVAYHFKSDLERIKRAFPHARTLEPGVIEEWNAGRVPLLLVHPASAGHGLNLQDGGNILVVFSHWWNLEEYQQVIERIGPTRQKQAGHDRPVFIHQLIARDTVDELVVERRETKREVQDLLLEAMKRRCL